MGRARRNFIGNQVYHILNRANGRADLFDKSEDYQAFERILEEVVARFALRVCSYCLMPNHWHLAVWPRKDQGGVVSAFMQSLTLTHTQRWHAYHQSAGIGHLYQGRFKSFPVQGDVHLLKVFRYIEQNALRAKLVERAQDWPHGSLWQRRHFHPPHKLWLAEWPVQVPGDWNQMVNHIPDAEELEAIRLATRRSQPFGEPSWVQSVALRLGLESTLHPRGRPRRDKAGGARKSVGSHPQNGT